MTNAQEAVAEAIAGAGGPARVAEELDVSVQAVCFWRDGKRRFPAEHAPTLERLNGGRIRCEQMCPGADWAYLRNPRPSVGAVCEVGQA